MEEEAEAPLGDPIEFAFVVPTCTPNARLSLRAPDGIKLIVPCPENVLPGMKLVLRKADDGIWRITHAKAKDSMALAPSSVSTMASSEATQSPVLVPRAEDSMALAPSVSTMASSEATQSPILVPRAEETMAPAPSVSTMASAEAMQSQVLVPRAEDHKSTLEKKMLESATMLEKVFKETMAPAPSASTMASSEATQSPVLVPRAEESRELVVAQDDEQRAPADHGRDRPSHREGPIEGHSLGMESQQESQLLRQVVTPRSTPRSSERDLKPSSVTMPMCGVATSNGVTPQARPSRSSGGPASPALGSRGVLPGSPPSASRSTRLSQGGRVSSPRPSASGRAAGYATHTARPSLAATSGRVSSPSLATDFAAPGMASRPPRASSPSLAVDTVIGASGIVSRPRRTSRARSPNGMSLPGSSPRSGSDAGMEIPASRGGRKMSEGEKLKELIRGVYQRKCRAKLSELDALLEKHKGEEKAIYEHVCRKYGETPRPWSAKTQ